MDFRICTLGTGTGIPRARRRSPSTLVRLGRYLIIFDTGPGALRALHEAGESFRDINFIFYTHFHPDHISDFVPFLFASRSNEYGRDRAVEVWGAEGIGEIYRMYIDIFGHWVELPKSLLTIREIDPKRISSFDLPFGRLITVPLYHTAKSIGYRIEVEGRALFAITGDTDYGENLKTLTKNVKVLVAECSFPDQRNVKGHLTPNKVGRIAQESSCEHLILTHLYPECDKINIYAQCKKVYNGRLTIARDLMWIVL